MSYEYGAEEVEEVLEEIDDTNNILMIKELVKTTIFRMRKALKL